uniref:Tyrosine--tRNA ligase n=1 Tax=Plectus sambesii TaxID=2011161 RepID=A0A914VJ13_9BILA
MPVSCHGRLRLYNQLVRRLSLSRCFCAQPPSPSAPSVSKDYHAGGVLERLCGDLVDRGIVSSTYPSSLKDEQFQGLRNVPAVVYAGFDPTSDSLHIGNLAILSTLLRASAADCLAIALVGGGTAQVGDPSGRTTERKQMAIELIEQNARSIEKQIASIAENFAAMTRDGCGQSPRLKILNNISWYGKMDLFDFFSISRHFRVGEMLKRKAVRSRMEDQHAGLNYAEFSYQILQSYDWLRLCEEYDCRLQIGGSDQLGHFDAGHDLVKKVTEHDAFGLCVPLITDERGQKLGKSTITDGAVWLDAKKTSPFAFYQFWHQRKDAEVGGLLRLFSFRPVERVEELLREHMEKPSRWLAQKELAQEMTLLVHGPEGLQSALKCTAALFSGSLDALSALNEEELEELFGGASTFTLSLQDVTTVLELAERVLPSSDSKKKQTKGAEGIIHGGGFSVNGQKLTDPKHRLTESVFLPNTRLSVVCRGKRTYSLVKWS